MLFNTLGDMHNPAILFFHAMGVTGISSMPVAEHLKDRFFCIMPVSAWFAILGVLIGIYALVRTCLSVSYGRLIRRMTK